MKPVRIRVIAKHFYKELAQAYLTDGKRSPPVPFLKSIKNLFMRERRNARRILPMGMDRRIPHGKRTLRGRNA